jgi:hypothetical protein
MELRSLQKRVNDLLRNTWNSGGRLGSSLVGCGLARSLAGGVGVGVSLIGIPVHDFSNISKTIDVHKGR